MIMRSLCARLRVCPQRVADGGPHINLRNLNLGDEDATAMAWAMMHDVRI
jgi:hypothetical protein